MSKTRLEKRMQKVDKVSEKGDQMEPLMLSNTAMMPALGRIWGGFWEEIFQAWVNNHTVHINWSPPICKSKIRPHWDPLEGIY